MSRALWAAVCAGALVLAGSARAGESYLDPFDDLGCGKVDSVYNALKSPSIFFGYVKCLDLCKSTQKDAIKYTNGTVSCRNTLIAHNLSQGKKLCANLATPDLRKSCTLLAESNAAEARTEVKTDRATVATLLDNWLSVCVADCNPP
ncbi:MAG TPA: hypothetical protein VMR50_04545 [Myxococcota bacterium]|nr:hypothetical protein [Myxococcota bacterium]